MGRQSIPDLQLVDTVVFHAPTLAARCEATVLEQLLRVAVRAHVERAEVRLLIFFQNI